jgi:PAS domain S-box-containing protein
MPDEARPFGLPGTGTVLRTSPAQTASSAVAGSHAHAIMPRRRCDTSARLHMSRATGNVLGRMAEWHARHALEVLAVASIAVWECDLTTGTVAWTGDLQAMFGRPAESFDGTLVGFLELIHPEDHARLTQAVEVALGRGGLYEVDFRAVLPDGSTRWLGERGRVLQDDRGQPTRIVGIVQDVTERKAADEALLVQALHDLSQDCLIGFCCANGSSRPSVSVRTAKSPP